MGDALAVQRRHVRGLALVRPPLETIRRDSLLPSLPHPGQISASTSLHCVTGLGHWLGSLERAPSLSSVPLAPLEMAADFGYDELSPA